MKTEFNLSDLCSTEEAIESHFVLQPPNNVIKSGTARSKHGAEKDRGIVVHIVIGEEPNGYWGGKALCGAEPGRRSNGWFSVEKGATCEKCISKWNKK